MQHDIFNWVFLSVCVREIRTCFEVHCSTFFFFVNVCDEKKKFIIHILSTWLHFLSFICEYYYFFFLSFFLLFLMSPKMDYVWNIEIYCRQHFVMNYFIVRNMVGFWAFEIFGFFFTRLENRRMFNHLMYVDLCWVS